MTTESNTSSSGPVFPGFKHYASVNDRDEIVELWSNTAYPPRVPGKNDKLLRDNGSTSIPYLFEPGDFHSLLDQGSLSFGIVYRYRFTGGAVVEKTPAEIAAEVEALRLEALPGEIRAERNRLLDEADKMRFEWRPMADAKREEWVEYMQELRDLTEQPGFPEAVVWPEKPE
jgi:hypothetical protein